MLRHLGLTSAYPFLEALGTAMYYPLVVGGALFVLYRLHLRLMLSGHNERELTRFAFIYVLLAIPATYVGSRAAGMFYHPPSKWSMDLLLENISSGETHTFHAAVVLSILILSIMTLIMRYRYSEVMDTVFLYVPIAHAIGRLSCLIIGCCWGRSVAFNILGFHPRVPNPIPLHSIVLNVCIFYFLKRVYDNTYLNPDTQKRYGGSVVASYLVLYGGIRTILEVFRKENRIILELTQAQIAMIFFILIGLAIFGLIQYRSLRSVAATAIDAGVSDAMNRLTSLLGGVVCYLVILFAMYHLAKQLGVIRWPPLGAESVVDAYGRLVRYLPALLLPVVSVYWLRRSGDPVWQRFKWKQSSRLFYVALIVSALPGLALFAHGQLGFSGLGHWPGLLVLCVLSALCGETVHRLAILGLFRGAGYSKGLSIVLQAVIYSVVHFMVTSPEIAVLSLLYGCLLGVLVDRTCSVTPGIICHSIVNLGILWPRLPY